MPIQTTPKIWHNGNLIPWEQATIHVMSHVVHYGSSVFEGIRCYAQPHGSAVFRLPEHMQRLIDSAKIKLWDLVNDLAKAKPTPIVRVGLYSYGHNSYDPKKGWVRKEVDLTDDLDTMLHAGSL